MVLDARRPLERHGTEITRGRVAAPAVVERLDEVEHRQARRVPGPEGAALDQLALERRAEPYAQGVVVAVADGTHRQRHVHLPAALAEGDGRVLRAAIAVVDDAVRGALAECHVERIQHQGRHQSRAHGPAHRAARVDRHHHRQEQEPLPGRNVGRVRHPQRVRP